jgi:hypothetical protein
MEPSRKINDRYSLQLINTQRHPTVAPQSDCSGIREGQSFTSHAGEMRE